MRRLGKHVSVEDQLKLHDKRQQLQSRIDSFITQTHYTVQYTVILPISGAYIFSLPACQRTSADSYIISHTVGQPTAYIPRHSMVGWRVSPYLGSHTYIPLISRPQQLLAVHWSADSTFVRLCKSGQTVHMSGFIPVG